MACIRYVVKFKGKLLNSYIRGVALCGVETWTLRKVDQKCLGSSKLWCWRRMEKIIWTDRGRNKEVPYFPAHKTHRDFFVRNFRKKKDECILNLIIYWKKTGLFHTKISKHNIIYSSQKPRKSSSLPLKSSTNT